MATTKIECVHILNLWIGMERLFDSCARQVLKTCQVRSSVVRQHDVVGARRLIITLHKGATYLIVALSANAAIGYVASMMRAF